MDWIKENLSIVISAVVAVFTSSGASILATCITTWLKDKKKSAEIAKEVLSEIGNTTIKVEIADCVNKNMQKVFEATGLTNEKIAKLIEIMIANADLTSFLARYYEKSDKLTIIQKKELLDAVMILDNAKLETEKTETKIDDGATVIQLSTKSNNASLVNFEGVKSA